MSGMSAGDLASCCRGGCRGVIYRVVVFGCVGVDSGSITNHSVYDILMANMSLYNIWGTNMSLYDIYCMMMIAIIITLGKIM